ncbi:MAG: RNA polymerase sigma factor [Polyangiaceae bacterium]|nr:RNA polymerase sigma factor [Polyangiaceae bacterium]
MTQSFRAFYDEHVRFVWRALWRLGVPDRDVPDAVQDVFVVVHRKLPEFEGRSKATTWLFAICHRVASDRRRMAHVRREIPAAPEPASEAIASDGDGAAALERRQARALLDAILARMPDEQRIVFSLFEIEQMSAEGIAELLDIPEGTVRSRLRLARASFEQSVARLRASERRASSPMLNSAEVWR